MTHYSETKKTRRIAAIVYLLFLGFILTGTYFSEQQKQAAAQQQSEANQ